MQINVMPSFSAARIARLPLLSGDRKTFELFRCEAPELVHLPQATFEWYAENYLDHYYPIRYLIRFNGIRLPEAPR